MTQRAIAAVSETDRYNCTSDWSHDGQSVLYARGIIPEQGGHAELWSVRRDGTTREMLYAEASAHIYGACGSPDGRYLLFTRSVGDLGPVDNTQTVMSIVRRSDTPMHRRNPGRDLTSDRAGSRTGRREAGGRAWDLGLGVLDFRF